MRQIINLVDVLTWFFAPLLATQIYMAQKCLRLMVYQTNLFDITLIQPVILPDLAFLVLQFAVHITRKRIF